MKLYKFIVFTCILVLCTAHTKIHKYYISNTDVAYVADKQSVQIISRIFIDDLERVLQERYDNVPVEISTNTDANDLYIETYLKTKLKLKINHKEVTPKYLGKTIEGSIVKCFLEVDKVKRITALEISNQILFDIFSEQQNITKLNINKRRKSYMLTKENDSAFISFN